MALCHPPASQPGAPELPALCSWRRAAEAPLRQVRPAELHRAPFYRPTCGVELHKLQVLQGQACASGHRIAVACARVGRGGAEVGAAVATGGQDGLAGRGWRWGVGGPRSNCTEKGDASRDCEAVMAAAPPTDLVRAEAVDGSVLHAQRSHTTARAILDRQRGKGEGA